MTHPAPGRLPRPCLMLVTGRALAGGEDALVAAVDAAVAGGVNAVQLREKDLPPSNLLALARRLREVTANRALLIVNGPAETALACRADGVHLPEHSPALVPPALVPPALVPQSPTLVAQGPSPEPRLVWGRSVHSLEAARRALSGNTDYLVAGPVYATRSHPGAPAAGVYLIESVARAAGIPVLAIGGVTPERVEEVIRAGATGIAVISAVLGAPSPGDAARELREALDAAFQRPVSNLQSPTSKLP